MQRRGGAPSIPAIERYLASIEKVPSECWLWTKKLNPKGYARFSVNRKATMVHRFAYEMVNGPIPDGLEVGHLCHVRHCVNPDHLEAMTHERNIQMALEVRGKSKPMTAAERNRNWRERERKKREAESGGWVSI